MNFRLKMRGFCDMVNLPENQHQGQFSDERSPNRDFSENNVLRHSLSIVMLSRLNLPGNACCVAETFMTCI